MNYILNTNIDMNKIAKIIVSVLFVTLLISCDLKVVEYHDSTISSNSLQEEKQKYLGAKVTIDFIGNDAKVTVISNDGESNSLVLTKVADANSYNDYQDIYEYEYSSRRKVVLKVSKLLMFVSSAKLEGKKDNSTMGYLKIESGF